METTGNMDVRSAHKRKFVNSDYLYLLIIGIYVTNMGMYDKIGLMP
jgi:hypothetical protein